MLKMKPHSEEEYRALSGHVMRRENGTTPNGNPVAGRWVLRDFRGNWIDCHKYRSDLAEHHGFVIDYGSLGKKGE
jgi:hypothetical protein